MSAPDPDGADVLVVVPTYNERADLAPLVARVHAVLTAARVLVVDDASPDGTGVLADDLAGADPRVRVLHRPSRAGLGAAYVDAFTRVLREDDGVGWVVQMDADGSHAPEDLPRMVAAGAGADAVLGSRYVAGGRVVDWPWHRELLSRGGNAYARRMLTLPIRDVTGGFRLYRRAVLEQVSVADVASRGYCFQVDMVFRVARAGFRVREVPITFVERTHGTSKMSGGIVREALWRTTAWGVRDRLRRFRSRPRRARLGVRVRGL